MIRIVQRPILVLILVTLNPAASAQETAAAEAGCYCLENYAERLFLWNCRDDETSPGWAICIHLGANGAETVTRVQLTDDWDRYEAGTSQCPYNCLPLEQSREVRGGGGSVPPVPDRRGWATRLFAGPGHFPPKDFAAYGIVAFPVRAADERSISRHLDICRAWTATLPSAITDRDVLPLPSEQMATIWPVVTDEMADDLNFAEKPCDRAVAHYGLVQGLQALRDVERAGRSVDGNGPYLLAWSPSVAKGATEAIVLVVDLSTVTTYAEAVAVFRQWRDDIENDPTLWNKEEGWSLEALRIRVRRWADRLGPRILTVLNL